MKKEYITPRVKVVAIRTMNVLCISEDAIKVIKEVLTPTDNAVHKDEDLEKETVQKISVKIETIFSSILNEIEQIEINISSDNSCLKSFALPKPTGIGNMLYMDYSIDPQFEKCKDILNYISPVAYSFLKDRKGCFEVKYALQNMIDRIDIEISNLTAYSNNKCIQNSEEVIDLLSLTIRILQKIISSFVTIINKRLFSFFGQPGEPSDIKGVYAVSDFYARLTALIYKIYLTLKQLTAPDQLAKKIIDGCADICYNLYHQAKSFPKETLNKTLDIELNPNASGEFEFSFNITIEQNIVDEVSKNIDIYVKSLPYSENT